MKRFIICLIALIPLPVSAHDYTKADGTRVAAGWIEKHHRTCCGREDCETVDGRLVFKGGQYAVKGWRGTIAPDKARISQDGRIWACRDLSTKIIRCLFLPATSRSRALPGAKAGSL